MIRGRAALLAVVLSAAACGGSSRPHAAPTPTALPSSSTEMSAEAACVQWIPDGIAANALVARFVAHPGGPGAGADDFAAILDRLSRDQALAPRSMNRPMQDQIEALRQIHDSLVRGDGRNVDMADYRSAGFALADACRQYAH